MEVGLIRSTIITLDAIVRTVRTSKCGEGVTEAKVASGELVVRTAGAKNQLFGIYIGINFEEKRTSICILSSVHLSCSKHDTPTFLLVLTGFCRSPKLKSTYSTFVNVVENSWSLDLSGRRGVA